MTRQARRAVLPAREGDLHSAVGGGSDGPSRKMAEELAGEIESTIVALRWPIGESLGSEPQLIERYGVSRAVFREAIRIVEHHGVARMRRGPGGGLQVTAPDPMAIERPATLYLDYAGVTAQDLFDARNSLELACVRIATRLLDEAGVLRLREILKYEIASGAKDVESGRLHDLHVVLAELTGNAAMRLFVGTLTQLTFEHTGHDQFAAEELCEVTRAHAAIVEAVISGDAALAEHRMRRHLEASAPYYH